MKNIFLTSCGIINNEIKKEFYNVITKDVKDIKVLYITTAVDGETDDDRTWMEEEYQTILDLGILKENIIEYKIGNPVNINDFDVMYMLGGNTFYLLDIIRKNNFDNDIKNFINSDKIYVGSSAGSIILGNSIEVAKDFDENNINMIDFTGLKLVDGLIVPHCNRKEEFINKLKNSSNEKLYLLYDGDGIVI